MKNKVLLLFDAHEKRPWHRDRLPGIKKAIDNSSDVADVELDDIYSFFGESLSNASNIKNRKQILFKTNIEKSNIIFINKVIASGCTHLVLCTIDNWREFLLPHSLLKLKDYGVHLTAFFGDDEFNHEKNKYAVPFFDQVVVYVKSIQEKYQTICDTKIYWLPNSTYIDKRFSPKLDNFKYDIGLVGAPIANRPQIVKALHEKGLKIAVYGSKKWKEIPGIGNSYKGFLKSDDFPYFVADCAFYLAGLEDHIDGSLHMNTKPWEAFRSKTLPIVTYYEPLLTDYMYISDKSMCFYNDVDDLCKKVTALKINKEKRYSILTSGLRLLEGKWSYEKLYEEFIRELPRIYREEQNKSIKKVEHEKALHDYENLVVEKIKMVANIFNENFLNISVSSLFKGFLIKRYPISNKLSFFLLKENPILNIDIIVFSQSKLKGALWRILNLIKLKILRLK